MADIIQLTVQLKEQVIAGFKKISSLSAGHLKSLDKAVSDTERKVSGLSGTMRTAGTTGQSEFGKTASAIRGVERAADDAAAAVKKMGAASQGDTAIGSRGSGFRNMALGSLVGGMALGAITMVGHKAVEAGRAALESGINFQNQIVGLSTFVGDKKAYSIVDRVAREGTKTPYTTAQLLPIERGLIAMGANTERAHRDTWGLANAVAATGGSDWALERMGWHMQQAQGQGYIDGRIMREFSMAGIPITKLLSQSMPQLKGLSQGKAMEKLDNMTISYDMVSNALYRASQAGGMFEGAMSKLSQTIGGKWSTFVDKMQISGWKITESQDRNIKHLEERMIGFADKLPAIASGMAGSINTVFTRIEQLSPTISDVVSSVEGAIKPIGSVLLSKPFIDFVKNVGDASAAILRDLTPAIKGMSYAMIDILKGSNWVYNRVKGEWQSVKDSYQYTFGTPGVRVSAAAFKATDYRPGHLHAAVKEVTGIYKQFYPYVFPNSMPKPKSVWQMGFDTGGVSRKNAFGFIDPLSKSLARAAEKRENTPNLQGLNDSIVGGGKKQLIINMYAPLYKVEHQVFQKFNEAIQDFEPKVRAALLSMIASAKMAM